MTKADLVEKIHNELGFQKKESPNLLESLFLIMKQTFASGKTLKISGFGSFVVKQKSDRRGRNPQTGETITIGARRIIGFKPSAILKQALNN